MDLFTPKCCQNVLKITRAAGFPGVPLSAPPEHRVRVLNTWDAPRDTRAVRSLQRELCALLLSAAHLWNPVLPRPGRRALQPTPLKAAAPRLQHLQGRGAGAKDIRV